MKRVFVGLLAAIVCLTGGTSCKEKSVVPLSNSVVRSSVPKITCPYGTGTGVVVGTREILTVDHVTRDANCYIATRSRTYDLTQEARGAEGDFAQLSTNRDLPFRPYRINCNGIIEGEAYTLAGWEGGQTFKIHAGVGVGGSYNTQHGGRRMHGMAMVRSQATQGMSGGPVLNGRGEVVALISSYAVDDHTMVLVQELSRTSAC
jgi:hypothetical protein